MVFHSLQKRRLLSWMHVVIGVAVLLVTMMFVSCRSEDPGRQTPEQTLTHEPEEGPAAMTRPAEIGLDQLGLVSDRLHIEPSKEAWSVEVFNDRAGDLLKSLAKLLATSVSISRDPLSRIAHDDFRGTALRPSELITVFEDDALLVRRPPETASPPADYRYEGAAGLAEALTDWIRPFQVSRERHAAFKIARVENTPTGTESIVVCQVAGDTPDGKLQQSATWQCLWSPDSNNLPKLKSIVVLDYEQSWGRSAGKKALFADCTEAVLGNNKSYQQQLVYGTDHWLARIERRFGMNPSGWQGLAVGDVNGDGLDDLYVCQPSGVPNRMFLQKPDGTAADVSVAAGVDWWDHSHAALLVDLDNDGDQDLVLATTLGLIFMANDGQGRFVVTTTKLCPEAMPFTLTAADYDNDGDLDIFACCYSLRGSSLTAGFLARPLPYHDANNGGRNCLFRNDRDWRFKNATRQVGLDINNRRFSLAAAWEDYDNDGDPDLYVANDYGRNNLYRNDEGQFVDVAATAGVEDISAGMSVSWGDYNQDGRMDLYVSNMWSSAGNRITYQRAFQPDANPATRLEFQRHARGNSLFQNVGDGTFRDVSNEAHVTMGRWAWGSRFCDINNDGREDLVVANGFITQEDTSDL